MNKNTLFPMITSRANGPDLFDELRSEMNRIFNRQFDQPAGAKNKAGDLDLSVADEFAVTPSLDVVETDTALEITIDVPGVKEEDVTVELEGNLLKVNGNRSHENTEENKSYRIVERSSGSFKRVLRLPFEPEDESVSAELESGVLTLCIAKPPQESTQARRISVSASNPGKSAPKVKAPNKENSKEQVSA
jgi:HSP20 family protein